MLVNTIIYFTCVYALDNFVFHQGSKTRSYANEASFLVRLREIVQRGLQGSPLQLPYITLFDHLFRPIGSKKVLVGCSPMLSSQSGERKSVCQIKQNEAIHSWPTHDQVAWTFCLAWKPFLNACQYQTRHKKFKLLVWVFRSCFSYPQLELFPAVFVFLRNLQEDEKLETFLVFVP